MKLNSSRSFPLQVATLAGLMFASTTLTVLLPNWNTSVRAGLQDSPKVILDEAWQLVNNYYIDGSFNKVDWQATRRNLLNQTYTSKQQAYDAIRAAMKQLNDPYTRFMDPSEFTALTTQTSGELSGIGIRLAQDEQTKQMVIVEPIPNSPASKAGLQSGDRLLSIDNQPTMRMTVEQASGMIRGKAGTVIKLVLDRVNQGQFELTLTRAVIELPTVSSAVRQEGNQKIGYIRLMEFNAHATEQMRQAIQSLQQQQVQGFVLDLRGNPGGLLQSGVEISRMWLDQGMIVRTVDRDGKSDPITANRTALTKLPLVLLVDGNSASCSEIVAGALQDNHRAVVVGTQTFGKALVQSIHNLSDGSGVAVTIAHYYTPNGTDINHKGIAPNVTVTLNENQQQTLAKNPNLIGTDTDPQYARAIASLRAQILANPNGSKPQAVAPVTNSGQVQRKTIAE